MLNKILLLFVFLLVVLYLIILTNTVNAAEWLACDIPAEPPAGYWVTHDAEPTEPPVWIDYRVVTDGFTGKLGAALYNIADMPIGTTFTAVAESDQGRRSDLSLPFVLKAPPSGPGALLIIKE